MAPSKLGFTIADSKGLEQIYTQATRLLRSLSSFNEGNATQSLKKILTSHLNKEEFNLARINFAHNAGINVQETIALLNGYKKLHSVDMLLPNIASPQTLVNNLVTVTFDNAEKYSPLELLVAAEILNLAFAMKFQDIMKYLLVLYPFVTQHVRTRP